MHHVNKICARPDPFVLRISFPYTARDSVHYQMHYSKRAVCKIVSFSPLVLHTRNTYTRHTTFACQNGVKKLASHTRNTYSLPHTFCLMVSYGWVDHTFTHVNAQSVFWSWVTQSSLYPRRSLIHTQKLTEGKRSLELAHGYLSLRNEGRALTIPRTL